MCKHENTTLVVHGQMWKDLFDYQYLASNHSICSVCSMILMKQNKFYSRRIDTFKEECYKWCKLHKEEWTGAATRV